MYSTYYGSTSNNNYNLVNPSTEISTRGMSFNPETSQWERPSYSSVASSASNYANNSSTSNNQAIPENPVNVYTAYYHGWNAIVERKKPPPPGLNHEWAKYYADCASRAAHHFFQNPGIRSAPFELPPAPPGVDINGNSVSPQRDPRQQFQQPTDTQMRHQSTHQFNPINSASSSTTLTYQQYMQKCLAQCRTDEERNEMDQELVRVVQEAVINGTLQKDWSTKPLLPVSRRTLVTLESESQSFSKEITSYASRQPKKNANSPTASSTTYYGHNGNKSPVGYKDRTTYSLTKKDRFSRGSHQVSNETNSYYGPASGDAQSVGSSDQSHYSMQKNTNKRQKMDHGSSYYGPSSFSSFTDKSNHDHRAFKPKRSNGFDNSRNALNDRAKRFASSFDVSTFAADDDFEDLESTGPVVKGRCKVLEKEYLRLTSAPKPELVRPQSILEEHLKNLLAERSNADTRRDYLWFCSQLKAIRQDLTVQHIRNSFTVKVYESHARIALEEGDLNEYNQCQTQLKYFYDYLRSQTRSSATSVKEKADAFTALKNQNEFIAYRLLYSVLLTQNEKYTGGSSDLLNLLQSLCKEQQCHPLIRFANDVRSAVTECNYNRFFAWLRGNNGIAGSHGSYLMARIAPSMRKAALPLLIRAYRPMSISVDFALRELGLDGDIAYGKKWLLSCGCIFSNDEKEILCKETKIRESDLDEKSSLI